MRVVSPLVAFESIERELGIYPALERFEVLGLASSCWIKIRTGGYLVGGREDELRKVSMNSAVVFIESGRQKAR